jgi:hypothetical protein
MGCLKDYGISQETVSHGLHLGGTREKGRSTNNDSKPSELVTNYRRPVTRWKEGNPFLALSIPSSGLGDDQPMRGEGIGEE